MKVLIRIVLVGVLVQSGVAWGVKPKIDRKTGGAQAGSSVIVTQLNQSIDNAPNQQMFKGLLFNAQQGDYKNFLIPLNMTLDKLIKWLKNVTAVFDAEIIAAKAAIKFDNTSDQLSSQELEGAGKAMEELQKLKTTFQVALQNSLGGVTRADRITRFNEKINAFFVRLTGDVTGLVGRYDGKTQSRRDALTEAVKSMEKLVTELSAQLQAGSLDAVQSNLATLTDALQKFADSRDEAKFLFINKKEELTKLNQRVAEYTAQLTKFEEQYKKILELQAALYNLAESLSVLQQKVS